MAPTAHEWATQSLRQMVIQQIEDTSMKFGNISVKTSSEYEQHILDKAQSRDDYLQMVARLILHIKEVRGKGGQMAANANQSGNAATVTGQLVGVGGQGAQLLPQHSTMNVIPQQMMTHQMATIRPNQLMQQMNASNAANRSNDISQNTGQPMQVTLQGGQIISQRGAGMLTQQVNQQPLLNTGTYINQQGLVQQTVNPMNNISNPAATSVAMSVGGTLGVQQPTGMLQKPTDQQLKVMQQLQYAKQMQLINQRSQQQQQQQHQQQQQQQQQLQQQNAANSSKKVQMMQPSPAKNVPTPSPQGQQPMPSPSQSMVSPAYINPPSIGTSASPLTQADEIMYNDKFKEMSKFIEPLKKLIGQMPNSEDFAKKRAKMTGMLEILTHNNRRVQMHILNQCENVLKRLFPDTAGNAPVGTPDPAVVEQVPTPVKPPMQPPMGEVVTNIITSANLMTETRQNILPGVLALNAPMIRPPPPLPKSRKRSYNDPATVNTTKKSPLPHALQMEIVNLAQKFNIKLDQTQSADKAGVTLICESRDENIPPTACSMSVRVPGNYPKTEPGYFLKDIGNSVKVTEVRDRMTKKLMRLPYAMTFSTILKAWEQSLLECYVS